VAHNESRQHDLAAFRIIDDPARRLGTFHRCLKRARRLQAASLSLRAVTATIAGALEPLGQARPILPRSSKLPRGWKESVQSGTFVTL
jgi:hypothetical protein